MKIKELQLYKHNTLYTLLLTIFFISYKIQFKPFLLTVNALYCCYFFKSLDKIHKIHKMSYMLTYEIHG